ncbi:MAG: TetR/AcrR family transcriptional regulator [Gemmatimonadota bacterium]|nr:TetR/AcrR family transcriptional regulator [Gemmatimonadota bacterium]
MDNKFAGRKEEIVVTALRIIAVEGMQRLTMKNIAGRIGISDAALYRHFDCKRDILRGVICHVGEQLFSRISRAAVEISDPVEKLREILRIHFSHIRQHQGLPRMLFSEAVHQNDPELRSLFLSTVNRNLELIRSILENARELGKVREDLDIESAALAFFGLVQSAALLWSLSDFKSGAIQEADAMFEVFVRGLD